MEVRFEVSKLASKQLEKLPDHICEAFDAWTEKVIYLGLQEVRKVPGYHDEALQGERFGQRSVRLNRSYRVIYKIIKNEVLIICILEVNKHNY
jgi:proteic killer suppression protein